MARAAKEKTNRKIITGFPASSNQVEKSEVSPSGLKGTFLMRITTSEGRCYLYC
jgi:hypothetical protein